MENILYVLFDDIISNSSFVELEDFLEHSISFLKENYKSNEISTVIKRLGKKYNFDVKPFLLRFELS